MKLYGVGGNYLLIDGDWVINGNWTAVFDKEGNVVNCKERPRPNCPKTPFLMNVPKKVTGDYNEVIEKCVELLKKRCCGCGEKTLERGQWRGGVKRPACADCRLRFGVRLAR